PLEPHEVRDQRVARWAVQVSGEVCIVSHSICPWFTTICDCLAVSYIICPDVHPVRPLHDRAVLRRVTVHHCRIICTPPHTLARGGYCCICRAKAACAVSTGRPICLAVSTMRISASRKLRVGITAAGSIAAAAAKFGSGTCTIWAPPGCPASLSACVP